MDVDYEKLSQLFSPEIYERFKSARENGVRFVQYTSAESAYKMIKGKCIWLRNTKCMNDYMEIEFGIERIIDFFTSDEGKPLWGAFDAVHQGLSAKIKSDFDTWRFDLSQETYVACVSEHDDSEDKLGRLSMWRAYGSKSGVAIVVNPDAMLSDSDATHAYTFPVFYKTDVEIKGLFRGFVKRISESSEFLKQIPRDTIAFYAFSLLQAFSLSLKHPAFREEREWRIVYRPNQHPNGTLRKITEVVGGIPQKIYVLDLKDIPEKGFVGVEIPSLVDRVLIGPTEQPLTIMKALAEELRAAGIDKPESKFQITNIPLRL